MTEEQSQRPPLHQRFDIYDVLLKQLYELFEVLGVGEEKFEDKEGITFVLRQGDWRIGFVRLRRGYVRAYYDSSDSGAYQVYKSEKTARSTRFASQEEQNRFLYEGLKALFLQHLRDEAERN